MLRRLHPEQPESFAFTPANREWAEAQMTKFPKGRQASAIIPILWRAQEQEGWLTRAAIEHVAGMLDLAYIRALEVATFYFMFQLQPVGSVAHVQVCGTLSCMICGAEDLIAVCKDKIAPRAHELSADGRFSWEEVECLGACANAPMAQIGKDYYEDLTTEGLGQLIDAMAAGGVPVPGPQDGRYAAEPASGLTSLKDHAAGRAEHNASVQFAVDVGDTLVRIDGTEVPMSAPWQQGPGPDRPVDRPEPAVDVHPEQKDEAKPAKGKPVDETGETKQEAAVQSAAKPPSKRDAGDGADATVGEAAGDGDDAKATAGVTVGPDDERAPKTPRGEGASAAPDSTKTSTKQAAVATGGTGDQIGGAREAAPERLDAPRGGAADDLKRIDGVGPKLETVLNDMGFWHFDQIAAWGPAEIAWVDARLSFKGRIERDDWVGQAGELARG